MVSSSFGEKLLTPKLPPPPALCRHWELLGALEGVKIIRCHWSGRIDSQLSGPRVAAGAGFGPLGGGGGGHCSGEQGLARCGPAPLGTCL